MKVKFIKFFGRMHRESRVHVYNRPYIIPVLGLLFAIAVVAGVLITYQHAPNLRPSSSHVVFLFDGGKEATIDTKAQTVGELVKKLPLNLIAQDVVEPSLDTKIVQDNFRINVYRARPVTVIDNNNSRLVTVTAQKSARVVAQDAGLTVYPEDNINFAPGNVRQNIIGEEVVIDRATPVSLNLYGTPLSIRTHSATVGELLRERGVKLDPRDTLTPAANTPITASLAIDVVRNGIQVITTEEEIPASIQYVNDDSLTLGATAIRQNGSPGKKAVTYQVNIQNGKEVSRTQIQEVIIQNPVPQLIALGSNIDVPSAQRGVMASAGIGASDYGYVDYIISHESGWCSTKWQGEVGGCPTYHGAPTSSYVGYGLCQATPGYKMASAGSDWATNAVTQMRWCNGYALGRYGSWYSAYYHWLSHHNW